FETFAPGWRNVVNLSQPQAAIRLGVFDHWRESFEGVLLSFDVEAQVALKVHLADMGNHIDALKARESLDQLKIKGSQIERVNESKM
ncbi:hypothetical protein AB9F36_33675, partial [Rhizobium leguminosarum]|uniref:hypothetical protein n=1 Tax=Rhizobium leguminosarum TaxID=384 RepID=UPI003F9AE913